ncbi:hypothetical protein [Flavobacterium sp. 3HN19-14]|uniref:hypothetical protein n=1 Tax=Flavobacterium sp. 3HN19-14 TaxID=3448133 RepID=UPI003EDF4202
MNGQFKFDLTMEDKSDPNKNGRSNIVKQSVINNLNLDMTYYGDGNGVGFLDNGKYEYMTKKMIETQRFQYQIKNDTLYIKGNGDKKFSAFLIILDEAINKDYFKVQIIDTPFPVGMYKVGESPTNNLTSNQ